jgi:protein O-GlcNAc transferase
MGVPAPRRGDCSLRQSLGAKAESRSAREPGLFAKMSACDWTNYAEDCARLAASVRNKSGAPIPFVFLAIPSSCQEQQEVAKLWVDKRAPPQSEISSGRETRRDERIHIAYISSDFRLHPVPYVAAGLFEYHDKSRFHLTAISLGADDGSEARQRIKSCFDEFVDAATWADEEIAAYISTRRIDIAVDLMGFTKDARTGVFAYHPAPVIVNYLGYPGTMAASYVDYIVADETVIPQKNRECFTEKVVYLPHSYYPNDAKRWVVGAKPERSEYNLPNEGFVFCCFNNNYKLTPDVFDLWMSVLRAVEGGVLWLLEDNTFVSRNLRKTARAKGVDEGRLVFAPRTSLPEHLARHRLADLFLDTLPYNAHTTACDALWAGVPVLTRIGATFAGRACASILQAIGLPELVTKTPEEYLKRAVELATNPADLRAIRDKLEKNREVAPLFDTESYTRAMENAYQEMHRRHQEGLSADDIRVSDLGGRSGGPGEIAPPPSSGSARGPNP